MTKILKFSCILHLFLILLFILRQYPRTLNRKPGIIIGNNFLSHKGLYPSQLRPSFLLQVGNVVHIIPHIMVRFNMKLKTAF